jgi:hypothetical protein
VKVTRDIALYGLTNFIADVGGYLGLLLGASILSIFDYCIGCFDHLGKTNIILK